MSEHTTMSHEKKPERFGNLPEEIALMMVESVDLADLPSLREVSRQMKRLSFDRFAANSFTDRRQGLSIRTLTALGNITSHSEFRRVIERISFSCSIKPIGMMRQDVQDKLYERLLVQAFKNIAQADIAISLSTYTETPEPHDDRVEAMLSRAIERSQIKVKGITVEDDRGDYLIMIKMLLAADSANATTHQVIWKTELPGDKFPRQVEYTDTTGKMIAKCSNCLVKSLPPESLEQCACVLANLDELNFTGQFANKPIKILCLEDCAPHPGEVLDILHENRTTIEEVEFTNLHLWGYGEEWEDLPKLLKELNLNRLTLSDVVRDRDSSIPMTSIVVIQEGDSEVFEGPEAISAALDRWIQANPH